jgi:hypothetical protein
MNARIGCRPPAAGLQALVNALVSVLKFYAFGRRPR